ncbi:hypothetical protein [Microvirga thermotolerans]|uniref:hypothetical protein n=1 Tax=Microvirga thermotolerans TaxID=2651334 RepID=UPI0018833ACD
MRSEPVWRAVVQTRAEAEEATGRYIDSFYNPIRRHSTLDDVSPVPFHPVGPNGAGPACRSTSTSGKTAVHTPWPCPCASRILNLSLPNNKRPTGRIVRGLREGTLEQALPWRT